MDAPIELLDDEHAAPTRLGSRAPILPYLWPFDWTQRQMYWFVLCVWIGATQGQDEWSSTTNGLMQLLPYIGLGLAGVIVDYVIKPSPEFWMSAWLEYAAVLVVSVPLWWRRLLPPYGPRALWRAWRDGRALPSKDGLDWPLAALPYWLSERLVPDAQIQPDGVLRVPRMPGRKPLHAVVIGIRPRPHPDLQAMLIRKAIIQTRLSIFKTLQGRWSLHMEVRPFDRDALEVASGPAWGWVMHNMAPRMILRRPSLVLYGDNVVKVRTLAAATIKRFGQSNMQAWIRSAAESRRLRSELWSDVGREVNTRVRVGIRRVVAGQIGYRSWAVTDLPQVIHLSWLRPLVSEFQCSVAIHVRTRPAGATRRSLQQRIRRWRAVDTDEDYADAVDDARRVRADMDRNRDTEASVGMYITARTEQAEGVAEALETSQCEFKPCNVMQHRALRATRTLGGDPLNRTMKLDLRTVATTDVLSTAGYWPDDATLIGEGLSASEPVGLNLFDPMNLNWAMFIAIIQGGGKTTLAELLAWRMANPHKRHALYQIKPQIVSVDFKASGDYAQLYRHLTERGQKASYNAWSDGPIPTIEGHMGFNLSDVPEAERGAKLLELAERIEEWSAAHSLERPLVLLLDEILALLEVRGGPAFLRKYGTQGRSLNIAPIFMTQDVGPVLAHPKAQLAFKNCAHIFLGRQNPAGVNSMVPLLDLDPEAQVLLTNAPQGAGLLRIERRDGPVALGVQVQPTEWELQEFGTNPAERAARWRRDVATQPVTLQNGLSRDGKEVHANGVVRDLAGSSARNGAAAW